jgi:hypothetical protein
MPRTPKTKEETSLDLFFVGGSPIAVIGVGADMEDEA